MSRTREATNDVVRRGMWRSRWAAIGAAIAVSLGAGGLFVAQAAPGPSESTIVTVSPERILDTRDPNNIGLPGPFVSAVSQKLKVTGSIPTATGTKTVVPTGATGVLLNVTPVNPTANGFISIRPGDATGAATTSSLNFTTGVAGIVPNAVQVAVPTAGANAGNIDITYDAYGVAGPTTDILIDVVGYMTSAGLQELVADVEALKAQAPIARSVAVGNVVDPPTTAQTVVMSATIDVPVSGLLQIVGSTYTFTGASPTDFSCRLTVGAGNTSNAGDLDDTDRWISMPANTNNGGLCSTNGATTVAPGTHVVNLVVSRSQTANGGFDDGTLDVLFIPNGTLTSTASLEESGAETE
jgi:hypothetical protein